MANKNKIINQAQKHISKGQWDRAIKELNKLIAEDPEDVRTLLKLGDVYSKKGDRQNATVTYKKVAESYSEQGFFLKAVAVYKQILKHDAQNLAVVLKLAELYEHLGLASEAMAQYQLAAQLHDEYGDASASLDVLKRMVELDAENVASRIKLAEGFSKEGRIPEAVEEFERAAEILKRQNRTDDYVKVAERLVYHAPERSDVVKELARLYLSRQDTKRALAKLQLCFKSEPRDIETLTLLAQAFNDLGQTQKTIFVYRELSQVYTETGVPEEAQRIQRAILQIDPYDAEARAALGEGDAVPGHTPPPHMPPPLNPSSTPPPVDEFLTPDLVESAAPSNGAHVDDDGPILAPSAKPPPPPPPASPDEVDKLITETDVYIKYGLREKALEHLRLVFSIDPDCIPAYEKLRDVHLAIGDQARAAEAVANMMHVYARRLDEAGLERARAELGELAPGHPLTQQGLPGVIPQPPRERSEPFAEEISIDIMEDSADMFDVPTDARERGSGSTLGEGRVDAPRASAQLRPPSIPSEPPPHEALPSVEALEDFPKGTDESSELPSTDVLADDVLSADILPDDQSAYVELSADSFDGREALFDDDGGDWPLYRADPPTTSTAATPNRSPSGDPTDDVVIESPVLVDPVVGFDVPDDAWSADPEPDTGSIAREAHQLPVAPTDLPVPARGASPLTPSVNPFEDDEITVGWIPEDPSAPPQRSPAAGLAMAEPMLPGPPTPEIEEDPSTETDGSFLVTGRIRKATTTDTPATRVPDAIVTLVPTAAANRSPAINEGKLEELNDDTDEAEFLISAGLLDEARTALANILDRAPDYPRAARLLAELDQGSSDVPPDGATRHRDTMGDAAGRAPRERTDAESAAVAEPEADTEAAFASSHENADHQDAEDFYDEGMAFREIGRLDEAISAFMHAAKSPGRRIASLELIGHCYVEKGLFTQAIQSFLAALQAGAQGPGATNLKYEVGAAHEAEGNLQDALSWFESCAADDAHHRDVSERIARVASRLTGPANGTLGSDSARQVSRADSVKKNKISYL